jgi:hypothetical protein
MTLPLELEQLCDGVHDVLPEAAVEIDRPADPAGEWWLDISDKDFHCSIAWRPARGFGIFVSKPGYNDQPDEVYRSVDVVLIRLGQLHSRWQRCSRLIPLSLAEIRQLREVRQTSLAATLDINQAAVSRLEHRDDMKLSSLQAYIGAMGGRVEIRVHFDAFDAALSVSTDGDPTSAEPVRS